MVLICMLIIGIGLMVFGLYEFVELQILEKNEDDWCAWHLTKFFKNKKSA